MNVYTTEQEEATPAPAFIISSCLFKHPDIHLQVPLRTDFNIFFYFKSFASWENFWSVLFQKHIFLWLIQEGKSKMQARLLKELRYWNFVKACMLIGYSCLMPPATLGVNQGGIWAGLTWCFGIYWLFSADGKSHSNSPWRWRGPTSPIVPHTHIYTLLCWLDKINLAMTALPPAARVLNILV